MRAIGVAPVAERDVMARHAKSRRLRPARPRDPPHRARCTVLSGSGHPISSLPASRAPPCGMKLRQTYEALRGPQAVSDHAGWGKVLVERFSIAFDTSALRRSTARECRETRPLVGSCRHEVAESRRQRAKDGDAIRAQPVGQGAEAVALEVVGVHGSAVQQRAVDRADGIGERERRIEQPAVLGAHAPRVGQVPHFGEHVPVRVHHPLGLPVEPDV
jgi:hypothetical protein